MKSGLNLTWKQTKWEDKDFNISENEEMLWPHPLFLSGRRFLERGRTKSAHDVLNMVVVEIKFMAIMRKTFGRLGYFKLLYLQTYFQIAEI